MSNKLEQLEFKLEKILGFRNMQEKLENMIVKFLTWLLMITIMFVSVRVLTTSSCSSNAVFPTKSGLAESLSESMTY